MAILQPVIERSTAEKSFLWTPQRLRGRLGRDWQKVLVIRVRCTIMVDLNNEQRLIMDSIADVAENEFADRAFTYDDGGVPKKNIELLADQGFLGINFDEEYGGGGLTEYEATLMTEIVGRVCPDTATYLAEQHLVAPRAVSMFGSEEAKSRYLPDVTSGESGFAIAMSEPGAGSNVKEMNTTVERKGDKLLLNGEKSG